MNESKQPPFYQRFNIESNVEDVRKRFINRILSKIHGAIPELQVKMVDGNKPGFVLDALVNVASELGVEYSWNKLFSDYAKADFNSCLLSLEALYKAYRATSSYSNYADKIDKLIKDAIALSEADLGIEWRDGTFWPSGAKLLDDILINENLAWLADKDYQNVLSPLKKGLRHFLEAQEKPERLADAVTDVYEAVEALAKVITGKDRDLSANAESFISTLRLCDYYKKMFKDYIDYANEYRHATKPGEKKNSLSRSEVEAFIYISGLFIRLATQSVGY